MSINISSSTLLTQLNASGSYGYSTTKEHRTVNTSKLSAGEYSASLKKSLRSLRKIDITTDNGKISAKKTLKEMVTTYNKLSDMSEEMDSDSYKRRLKKMDALFDKYSEELEKFGIKKNSKGKITFDKLALNEIDESDSEDFNALFGKDAEFSKGLEKYNVSIASIAKNNVIQTTTSTHRTMVNIKSGSINMANNANKLSTYITALQKSNDVSSSLLYADELISSFNSIFEEEEKSQTMSPALEAMKKLIEGNSALLNSIGIGTAADGSSMSFLTDGRDTFSGNPDGVLSVFSGSFGSSLKSCSEELFCQLLETEKHNVKVNEYA